MLETIIDAIKAIIGLRGQARQDRKAMLEIQKLEKELSEKCSNITSATLDEVRKYDPKYGVLLEGVLHGPKKKKKAKKKKKK